MMKNGVPFETAFAFLAAWGLVCALIGRRVLSNQRERIARRNRPSPPPSELTTMEAAIILRRVWASPKFIEAYLSAGVSPRLLATDILAALIVYMQRTDDVTAAYAQLNRELGR